ncbi:protein phosphatase [Synechococcus sp. Tobar12-5m-g]|uniref:protein phosphatase n=1 Tax=unclassified Synechococcus TaxID=2626047 RepID=UPI0020CBBC3D|nr:MULTISPECIES: protein phosphatase [unclassified Synechococcus]MCP9771211.1 protein phosphatase [Synechococcus sp. Tobar12-5m-g]MCP9872151.1 protein phosphatase [Synechococcus sp. Cruz CV-v-12]
MSPPAAEASALQAGLFDFALGELVRQHRESFSPLWTPEGWAKLMIWLALNSGCSGDREALEAFAASLGPVVTGRMRRLFFERELADLNLKLMADPAEAQVLVWPLEPGGDPVGLERVAAALEAVGLADRMVEQGSWQLLEDLVAVPWRQNP